MCSQCAEDIDPETTCYAWVLRKCRAVSVMRNIPLRPHATPGFRASPLHFRVCSESAEETASETSFYTCRIDCTYPNRLTSKPADLRRLTIHFAAL